MARFEQHVLLLSLCNTLIPKLVPDDIALFSSLLSSLFPGEKPVNLEDPALFKIVLEVLEQRMLKLYPPFLNKLNQLNAILKLSHGVMLVGETGTGKTQCYRTLIEALERLENRKAELYVIDPKAIHKDFLYGRMDPYTMEWTDGVFTAILRKILANQLGEAQKRHWLVFDGDVDPEWAENLNSVLDDNKLLTLPNGERLAIPPNVRILFEVEHLKYATLATVSRCGMVWFADDVLSPHMVFDHYLTRLSKDDFDDLASNDEKENDAIRYRKKCLQHLRPFFQNCLFFEPQLPPHEQLAYYQESPDRAECVVLRALRLATRQEHIMAFTLMRATEAFFALVRKALSKLLEHRDNFPEY